MSDPPPTGAPSEGDSSRPTVRPDPARWRWFAAWAVVGALAGATFAAAFAGLVMLPFAGVGALLLMRGEAARRGIPGLVLGGGLDVLAVAYINRRGPGDVCTFTVSASACVDEFDPLPWLIIGVVLTAAGVAGFLHSRRHRAA